MVSRRQIIKANHEAQQVALSEDELGVTEGRLKQQSRIKRPNKSVMRDEQTGASQEGIVVVKAQQQAARTDLSEIKSRLKKLARQQRIGHEEDDDDDDIETTLNNELSRTRQQQQQQQKYLNNSHSEDHITKTSVLPLSDKFEWDASPIVDSGKIESKRRRHRWLGQTQRETTTTTTTTTSTSAADSSKNNQAMRSKYQRATSKLAAQASKHGQPNMKRQERFDGVADENARQLEQFRSASSEDEHFRERDLYRNFDPYSIYGDEDDEEDVWYSEEKLKQDHIQEIINKWHSIDDEIWAKIICMEQNRRIAKAYARQHTININGSRDEYLDGTTLGLNLFENPDRDSKTSYIKQYIGEGIKIKIHQSGDIFVKRLSRSNVFVHQFKTVKNRAGNSRHQLKVSQSSSDVYALNSSEGGGPGDFYGVVGPRPALDKVKRRAALLDNNAPGRFAKDKKTSSSSSGASSQTPAAPKKSPPNAGMLIRADKVVRLFSMAKFRQALEFESRKSLPNRSRLLNMCISVVSFVMNDQKMLNLPSWIMVINIVAMDLLSSEIGLYEPYDDLVPIGNARAVQEYWSARNPLTARNKSRSWVNRSFECFESHDYENDDDDEEDQQQQQVEGDDEDEDMGVCCDHAGCEYAFGHRQLRQDDPVKHHGRNEQANSDCEHTKSEGANSDLLCDRDDDHHNHQRPTNAIDQLGSSSSGFVSSHRNDDSSANSSSSNIASSDIQLPVVVKNKNQVITSKVANRIRQLAKAAPANNNTKQVLDKGDGLRVAVLAKTDQVRGKRPPKLPHGLGQANSSELELLQRDQALSCEQATEQGQQQQQQQQVIMSEPIPIPAPPTSAGGPSGKANLILVSPTGLSLPVDKAKSGYQQAADGSIACPDLPTMASSNMKRMRMPPGEQTKRAAPKLPLGIPSHAQLAPPATRKHILRYLMSMGRQQQQQQPRAPPPPPPARGRVQRPLPGLPKPRLHNEAPPQPDEGLYYRGLQARATQARWQAAATSQPQSGARNHWLAAGRPPMGAPPIDVTNIVTNFKHNALFRQQFAKHSHHQQQLVNLQLAAAQRRDARRLMENKLTKQQSTGGSKESQLARAKRSGELTRKPYMRSLDSLHVKTAPNSSSSFHVASLSTLLNSVGNLLKGGQKASKSALGVVSQENK